MKSPLVFPRWSYLNFLDKYYPTFPHRLRLQQIMRNIKTKFYSRFLSRKVGKIFQLSRWNEERKEGRKPTLVFPLLLASLKALLGNVGVEPWQLINDVLIAGPGDTHRNDYSLIILFILITDIMQ